MWRTAQTQWSLLSHPPPPECSSHSCTRRWTAVPTKFTWASFQFHPCGFREPGPRPSCVPPAHPHPRVVERQAQVLPGSARGPPCVAESQHRQSVVSSSMVASFKDRLQFAEVATASTPHNAAPVLGGRARAEQHTQGSRSSPTSGYLVSGLELGREQPQGSLEVLGQSPGWAGRGLSLSQKGEASRHDCI